MHFKFILGLALWVAIIQMLSINPNGYDDVDEVLVPEFYEEYELQPGDTVSSAENDDETNPHKSHKSHGGWTTIPDISDSYSTPGKLFDVIVGVPGTILRAFAAFLTNVFSLNITRSYI